MSVPPEELESINPIGQLVIVHGLTQTQAAVLYATALEGAVRRKKLRSISGISDRRTMENALERLKTVGVLQEDYGKITVKSLENYHQKWENYHFPQLLHLRTRELTNTPNGVCVKNTQPNEGDMDASASNPPEPGTPNGVTANAGTSPRPILITEDLELVIGFDVEGENMCDTAQVRNQCGRDALIRAWNETAAADWIPQGDKLTPDIRAELHKLARYLLTKGNKDEPTKAWILYMWNGRHKRGTRPRRRRT